MPKESITYRTQGRRSTCINDALHGNIYIDGKCREIVDTPQFQRLRHIRQLQACHYVYPCAQHTRLEHSLGVCHLAGVVLDRLHKDQPELHITPREKEMVRIAGLCHDIGHGCFGHMLDYELFPKLVDDFKWVHEERSCELLDLLVEENNIDLDTSSRATVKSLIRGDRSKTGKDDPVGNRMFLWDIVANSNHGIDVDKFDYLARDSRECNIKISFDHHRVIELMRVVDGEICFDSRGAESVYDIFHARSRLYKFAYFHRATRSIEKMISDAVMEANHVLKLQDCVHNLPRFCKLDDTILREINRSGDPSLAKSRELIRRIERRDLYRYVDEFVVPPTASESFKEVTADDIFRHKVHGDFTSDDLVVQNLKIDYGKGSNNPVDHVGFFDDRLDRPRKETIHKDRVSNLIPSSYKDVTVRLYVKRNDPALEEAAREAFTTYQRKRFGQEVMRTPSLLGRRTRLTYQRGLHGETGDDLRDMRELRGRRRSFRSEEDLSVKTEEEEEEEGPTSGGHGHSGRAANGDLAANGEREVNGNGEREVNGNGEREVHGRMNGEVNVRDSEEQEDDGEEELGEPFNLSQSGR